MDKTKFDPIIYCLGEKGALARQVEDIGITVKEFGLNARVQTRGQQLRGVFKIIRDMKNALKADRPYIVHTYLYWANIFGGIAAKLAGIKNIVTSRRSLGLYKDRKPWMQWVENMINLITDVVTANSQEVYKDTLRREKFIGKKMKLIYNGVNETVFQRNGQDYSELKRQLQIPDHHIVVTNVANLIAYKGHREFIEAACSVLKVHDNVSFLLVGRDGGMQQELEKRVKECGITDKVKFLGTRQDIVEILNITNIQVLSSHQEGFSNAILEGMACSLPLVVTHVGGNPEAVIDDYNGYVVPPHNSEQLANALKKLLSDDSRRSAMGERGRQRIEELFTLRVMAQQYRKLYEQFDKAIV
jgi:glycosyltransferase involved in cell wall biosynthesis